MNYLENKRFVSKSERHFHGDARYDLENVRKGLLSRPCDYGNDTRLLERICAAWIKANAAAKLAPDVYQATPWWRMRQETSLVAVMRALATRDIPALSPMYRNFFRDRCSKGLVETPAGIAAIRSGALDRLAVRHYLADLLYRIDCWRAQTGDRFKVSDLAAPAIGNPFGVDFDGSLVTAAAPYQHYCAQRVIRTLGAGRQTVVEIGGGFGGMAYYLLRCRPNLTYLDFDVPESLALTTYYLGTALPELRLLLYGENNFSDESITAAGAVLMPPFELEKLPVGCADVTISSHTTSDMSPQAMRAYLALIARFTRGHFFYIGHAEGAETMARILNESNYGFRLLEKSSSQWHKHTHPMVKEVECHYRVGEP